MVFLFLLCGRLLLDGIVRVKLFRKYGEVFDEIEGKSRGSGENKQL